MKRRHKPPPQSHDERQPKLEGKTKPEHASPPCVVAVNEALKTEFPNARVQMFEGFTLAGEWMKTFTIPLAKVNKAKRGKLPTIFASYCPLCGKKLEEGQHPDPEE